MNNKKIPHKLISQWMGNQVDSFKHQAVIIEDGKNTMSKLSKMWKCQRNSKMWLVTFIFLYGCESWTLFAETEHLMLQKNSKHLLLKNEWICVQKKN